MTSTARRTIRLALALVAAAGATATTVALSPAALGAQTCFGTPRRGGLAFEHARVTFGHSDGASGALAGNHFGLGLGYRHVAYASDLSANDVNARFALIFGAGRLQICPGLGVEYQRSTWEAGSSVGTLNTNQLTGRAGLGLGFEQPVAGGLSLIPFVVGQFAYVATHYDLNAPDADVNVTGDTASRADLQYGLLARYRFLWAGFVADHFARSGRPYRSRVLVGLTFAGGPPRRRR